MALAFGIGWLAGFSPFARLRFDAGAGLAGVAATLPLLLLLRWCLGTSARPVRHLLHVLDERISPFFEGTSFGGIVLLSLLAGIGEESLFRGVIQNALDRWLPIWMAVVATGVLFGMAHWLTTAYAVIAGVVGIYLGALFVLTSNLLVPIVTHAVYDVVALCVLVRRSQQRAG